MEPRNYLWHLEILVAIHKGRKSVPPYPTILRDPDLVALAKDLQQWTMVLHSYKMQKELEYGSKISKHGSKTSWKKSTIRARIPRKTIYSTGTKMPSTSSNLVVNRNIPMRNKIMK